ncbi:MAG: hypothetical protein C0497_03650 [Gemmatimonas sp.]|nr:hypothetical protein [Gemmatimonas sp.]
MELNRDANQQAQMGVEVSADSGMRWLSKGDLLFFGQKATAERAERITHVAIYLQDRQFIHTPGGSGVRIDSFDPATPRAEGSHLQLLHADPRPVAQRDLAVHHARAVEDVVADQERTVEVGPVHHR